MATRRELLAQIAVASAAAASAHAAQALQAAVPVKISPIQRSRGVVQTVQGPMPRVTFTSKCRRTERQQGSSPGAAV